jgi:hypothetical protein
VRKRGKASFDPKIFLAKVGEGKTVSKYWKDQIESRVSFFMNKFRKLGFIGAPRPASPSAGKFRQGRQAGADRGKVQSRKRWRRWSARPDNGKLEVHNSLLNVVLHDKPEIKTRDEEIRAE